VLVLYSILQMSIEQQLVVPQLPVKKHEQFSGVILYDATLLTLPPLMQSIFQGSHKRTLAQMKLQVGDDYLNAPLCSVTVHEGRSPDQKDSGLLAQAVQDALLIFDLGYFDQRVLAQIQAQKAYFVTRYQSQTTLYDPITDTSIDLVKELRAVKGNWFEAVYRLGHKCKVPVCLIAHHVSQQVAEKRSCEIRRKAKRLHSMATPSFPRGLGNCDYQFVG